MYNRWIESVGYEKRKELMLSTMPWIVVLVTVCLLSGCEKWEGIGEAPDGRLKSFTTLGKQLWWRDCKRLEERQIDKRINFSRTPSSYDVGETERD